VEDTLGIFEQQIERLLGSYLSVKEEKQKLLEANSELQNQIDNLKSHTSKLAEDMTTLTNFVEQLKNQNETLIRQNAEMQDQISDSKAAKNILDSLLSKMNNALADS
jgi:chromosome segregation ATPase